MAGNRRYTAGKGGVQRSVAARSEAANSRSEVGHGEMDTVKVPQNGHTDCLLTLPKRKTRAQIIRKLPDGKAVSVVAAFPLLFTSVTADNSVEFSDYEGLERSCRSAGKRFSLYFAHPYQASERGSNEHANGMIRQFSPKGTGFSLVSGSQAAGVQNWMNGCPHDTGRTAACPVTTWQVVGMSRLSRYSPRVPSLCRLSCPLGIYKVCV